MNLTDRIAIPDHVIAREVGDETMILDLPSGTYFSLDDVGAEVWRLIAQGLTVSDICRQIAANYVVSREQAEGDVFALLGELEQRQLITTRA